MTYRPVAVGRQEAAGWRMKMWSTSDPAGSSSRWCGCRSDAPETVRCPCEEIKETKTFALKKNTIHLSDLNKIVSFSFSTFQCGSSLSIKNIRLNFIRIKCYYIPIDSSLDDLQLWFWVQLDRTKRSSTNGPNNSRYRNEPFIFRHFATQRFIQLPPTQKQSCRAFKELSNGCPFIRNPPKVKRNLTNQRRRHAKRPFHRNGNAVLSPPICATWNDKALTASSKWNLHDNPITCRPLLSSINGRASGTSSHVTRRMKN